MKKILLIIALVIAAVPVLAQNEHNCSGCPNNTRVRQEIVDKKPIRRRTPKPKDNSDKQNVKAKETISAEITAVFPTAKYIKKDGVKKIIFDANKEQLGYVVYSKPASDTIKGYADQTPLMVAFSMKDRVVSVVLLDNLETPSFLNKVLQAGLLDSWNGMKAKKAAKKKVDTVSGATYSSKSIIETFQAALSQIL